MDAVNVVFDHFRPRVKTHMQSWITKSDNQQKIQKKLLKSAEKVLKNAIMCMIEYRLFVRWRAKLFDRLFVRRIRVRFKH